MLKKTLFIIFLVITVFAAGFAVSAWYGNRAYLKIPLSKELPFINKTITANLGKHFIINFKPLRMELEKIQKNYPQKTYIYFSYLNNGSWVGLNEREEFVAASTLKVPIAMAVFKAVEEKKIALTDSYSLEELDLDEHFGDLYKVGTDKEFTVGELVEVMLEQSDNTAFNAILNIFHLVGIEDPLGEVYGFLGWEFASDIPEFGRTPDYSKITLKTLTNLFIALYDTKYVNIEHSNQILEYLANTPFNNKIVAGIPKNVVVSHKIGIAIPNETFSDCGIVYAPNRHYLLCLGSNGGDEDRATRFMAEVSKTVYNYVINN